MLTLISGGARSGKSRLALEIAHKSRKDVVFLATAEALDEEMKKRIADHKKERPAEWELIEEPRWLADVLRSQDSKKLFIIDCLTIFVSNLLGDGLSDEAILSAAQALITVIKNNQLEVVIVTNEVGLGIVPDNPLARRFRDLAGRINQEVAAASDEVYVCFLGRSLKLS